MENKNEAMVSRSLRLRKDTLAVLKEQADLKGLGITVYIRTVLESLVENLEKQEPIKTSSFGDESINYPEY